jgi:YHS domain-containing protein
MRPHPRSLTWAAGLTLCIMGISMTASALQAAPADAQDDTARIWKHGIWKYYVPKNVKGELDNYDPIGLIGGALIKTDCLYHWQDEAGKLYCFASPTSLVYFENSPETYVKRATEAWQRLAKPGS